MPNDKKIGSVQLDVITEEAHESDLNISSNPRENGFVATDGAVILPKQATITGTVSDIKGQLIGIESDSSTATYESLVRLQESRQTFDYQSKYYLYSNVYIAGIRTVQTVDEANELTVQVALQQVQFSTSQTIPLPKEKISPGNNSAKDRGQSTVDQGTQSPDSQGPINDPSNKTTLAKIVDGISI